MSEHLERAVQWLLQRQHPDGWWAGELETNVTMTAEHVMLMRFLGIPLDEIRRGAAEHILQEQRGDGSWALYYDGPADLSTTIEAYVALKVLGVDPARGEIVAGGHQRRRAEQAADMIGTERGNRTGHG